MISRTDEKSSTSTGRRISGASGKWATFISPEGGGGESILEPVAARSGEGVLDSSFGADD